MTDKKDKIWIVASIWSSGHHFEEDVLIYVFSNEKSARKELESLKEEAMESFKNAYDDEDIELSEFNDSIEIQAFEYSDYWTGYMYEEKIRD